VASRAQSKAATREALIRAGLELFEEQGVVGPSLDAICERAGRTRGAFYVHFADREDFMVAVMTTILTGYLSAIVQSPDPGGDLRRSIERFSELVLGEETPLAGQHLRLLLEGTRTSAAVREAFGTLVGASTATLVGVIAGAQAHGTMREDLQPEAVADLLVSLVLGVLAMLETGVADLARLESMRRTILDLLGPV